MVKENQTPSDSSIMSISDAGMKATQVIKIIIPEYSGRPHENIHEFLDAAE